MDVKKVVTAQRDYTAGELDAAIKRADDNPRMKAGARQMSNWRMLNSKGLANRPGRSLKLRDGPRVDEVLMSPGNTFYLVFGVGTLIVYNATWTQVFGTSGPWVANTVSGIVWDVYRNTIYITYNDNFPSNIPIVLTWDGVSQVSTWTSAAYAEDLSSSGKKRTIFYRLSPLGITLKPSAPVGGGFVQALTISNGGVFTTVPTVTIGPPAAGGITATAAATISVNAVAVVSGGLYATTNPLGATVNMPNGVALIVTGVTTVGANYVITSVGIGNGGSISAGSAPANPVTATGMSGGNPFFSAPTFNLFWDLGTLALTNSGGSNYTSAPVVSFSPSGGAVAVATVANAGVNLTTTLTFSAGMQLTNAQVGTRIRFCNRQILITGVTSATVASGLIEEPLFPGAILQTAAGTVLTTFYSVGDEVIGQTSGAKGIVTGFESAGKSVDVQQLTGTLFQVGEILVGPNGAIKMDGSPNLNLSPFAVTVWDEEVMNAYRGYPRSCFVDQGRLGFCDFPALPNLIGWSAVGDFGDLYTDENNVAPVNAIQELTPGKSRVLFNVPGPEGSEFVFCDNGVYYIPINQTTPLQPGSVAFNTLSGDGAAQVKPRLAQQSIIFVSAGSQQIKAVQPVGAYTRPYIVDDITELHAHLLNSPLAIAIPGGSNQFEERYIYVLNSDGTLAVGKYSIAEGRLDTKNIGWLPWSNSGAVKWVSARQGSPNVLMGSSYTPNGVATGSVIEQIDASQYLDLTMLYNSPPAPINAAKPGGKGPLWWLAGGAVDLMDGLRMMGTYQIDANGFLVPQNNAGEDFTSAALAVGQAWTATLEPFVPAVQAGQDVGQRMRKRRIMRHEIYVTNSSGFTMVRFFAGPVTRTSPPVGTVMKVRRIPAWNQDDDPTVAPPLREQAYPDKPLGRNHDPRVGIIKDTPGPLTVLEQVLEVSV